MLRCAEREEKVGDRNKVGHRAVAEPSLVLQKSHFGRQEAASKAKRHESSVLPGLRFLRPRPSVLQLKAELDDST